MGKGGGLLLLVAHQVPQALQGLVPQALRGQADLRGVVHRAHLGHQDRVVPRGQGVRVPLAPADLVVPRVLLGLQGREEYQALLDLRAQVCLGLRVLLDQLVLEAQGRLAPVVLAVRQDQRGQAQQVLRDHLVLLGLRARQEQGLLVLQGLAAPRGLLALGAVGPLGRVDQVAPRGLMLQGPQVLVGPLVLVRQDQADHLVQ